jgi:hypothetical protein
MLKMEVLTRIVVEACAGKEETPIPMRLKSVAPQTQILLKNDSHLPSFVKGLGEASSNQSLLGL